MSRITLVSQGDQKTLEQIKKQLNKLIDVIKVQDLTDEEFIDRELMLVKMKTTSELKELLNSMTPKYRIHVVEENDKITTIECTESRENRKGLFEKLKLLGILEIAQTGAVALSRKAPKE